MKFIKYLYSLDNGTICLYPNYSQKLEGDRGTIINCIVHELQQFLNLYGKSNKFVILLDLTKVKIIDNHDFILYRKLKQSLERIYPDKLEKVIIYDYSKKSYYLLKIVKSILDKEVQEKIVTDKNYRVFIDKFLEKTAIVDNSG